MASEPAAAGAPSAYAKVTWIARRVPSGHSAIARPATVCRIARPCSTSSRPAAAAIAAGEIETSCGTSCPVARSRQATSPTAPRSAHTPIWRTASGGVPAARRPSHAAAIATARRSASATP